MPINELQNVPIVDKAGRPTPYFFKYLQENWNRTGGIDSNIPDVGDLLAKANNLSDLISVSTARTNLGLGTAAVQNVSAFCQTANNLGDLANTATARVNLGLVIGTNVQAFHATLSALAAFNTNGFLVQTATGTFASRTITAGAGITVTNGNGVSGDPTIALTTPDAMVLVDTKTASNSANIDFTGLSTTYKKYIVVIDNLNPATNATSLYLRMSTDNGATFKSTNEYQYHGTYSTTTPANSAQGAASSAQIILTAGNTISNAGTLRGEVHLISPASGVMGGSSWVQYPDGTRASGTRLEFNCDSATINAIRFQMNSGNINTATFKLYALLA